jgi:hypothetical protein
MGRISCYTFFYEIIFFMACCGRNILEKGVNLMIKRRMRINEKNLH